MESSFDLMKLKDFATKNWLCQKTSDFYDPSQIIKTVFQDYIQKSLYDDKCLSFLEFTRYLEYLWDNFNEKTNSCQHILSILLLINQKIKENVNPWEIMTGMKTADGELLCNSIVEEQLKKKFSLYMDCVFTLLDSPNDELSYEDLTNLILFVINCIKSLENELLRNCMLPFVSIQLWEHINPKRRTKELQKSSKLQSSWKKTLRRNSRLNETENKKRIIRTSFLCKITNLLLKLVDNYENQTCDENIKKIRLVERILELFIDLESQLSTRRFTYLYFDDHHIITKCLLSPLFHHQNSLSVVHKLLDMFRFYMGFEINNITGKGLTLHEIEQMNYEMVKELQRIVFLKFPEIKELICASVQSIQTKEKLKVFLKPLSDLRFKELLVELCWIESIEEPNRELMLSIMFEKYERRLSQIDAINKTPLFPSEKILFDKNIPNDYEIDICLALPKLNLQFLTLHDYLLRNLNLFMLESSYEIQQDIIDIAKRMPAVLDGTGKTHFEGWARMAMQVDKIHICEIAKPNLGEFSPSKVRADIIFDSTLLRKDVKSEWESLRKKDVLFLVLIKAVSNIITKYDPQKPFASQIGIQYIRGCEVEGYIDHEGRMIEDVFDRPKYFRGNMRTLRVSLDTNQYNDDVNMNMENIYNTFNLLIRRKPKENNFKSVLATIRDLMNTSCVVPEWLHDIFLGYGAPDSAHYLTISDSNCSHQFNFKDTFIDLNHLKSCFGDYNVVNKNETLPPFLVTFPPRNNPTDKTILVESIKTPYMGPFSQTYKKINCIKFTSNQTEAIKAAMHSGLTLVVGPPGTGKTDVAVQIISNWYTNFPEQRTLIVTHSNQALNQIFEKIMKLDIEERHLLRLGMGEKDIDSEKVFTKYGRVNYILERRLNLLHDVQRIAEEFGIKGDMGHTCETAGYFYSFQVLPKWNEFLSKIGNSKQIELLPKHFPFPKFFENSPIVLFQGNNYEEDFERAEGCFRHITKIFTELEEFKAFEILRTGSDRVDYLLIKEAKIIAMTCTHAALKRNDLVNLKFQYDNVLMEESGQILEIETFIPLMCQNPENGRSRLKRVVLIGDHHQLPPVIKNQVFQKFCNMEQSMFTRFIRLNVPSIHLNKQGRARPSIANLYNWRYKDLGNLNHVSESPVFLQANSGFAFEYQFIDVQDMNGQGEAQPQPYFYQNLAEAEYVCWTFMFMRLLGYPPEKISIITTYNGQKYLIKDIINTRCSWNPMFGSPLKITTVDKYQGQQNDYILLSLVRTRNIGHIRDMRRLVVSLSRARLGLYVFGRESLFSNCIEIQNAMNLFKKRPLNLTIIPMETYPTERKVEEKLSINQTRIVKDVFEMSQIVEQMKTQSENQ